MVPLKRERGCRGNLALYRRAGIEVRNRSIGTSTYVPTLSEVQFCLGELLYELSEALVEALVKGVENTEECCG